MEEYINIAGNVESHLFQSGVFIPLTSTYIHKEEFKWDLQFPSGNSPQTSCPLPKSHSKEAFLLFRDLFCQSGMHCVFPLCAHVMKNARFLLHFIANIDIHNQYTCFIEILAFLFKV